MFTMGLLTFIGAMFLFWKLKRKTRKRIIGHNGVSDLALTVGAIFLFMGTATISGMMAGIVAGVAISVALYLAKKTKSHTTWSFSKMRWENHEAEWSRPHRPRAPVLINRLPFAVNWTATQEVLLCVGACIVTAPVIIGVLM